MTTLPVGTVKTQFGRAYVLVAPRDERNFYEWRPTNIPVDEDSLGVIGILPIQTTSNPNTGAVQIDFNIGQLATAFGDIIPYNTSWVKASRIDKRYPVESSQNRNVAVLTFNPSSLSEILPKNVGTSAERKRRMRSTVRGYNRDNAVVLSATAPMAVDTVGDNSTVSFDISALNPV